MVKVHEGGQGEDQEEGVRACVEEEESDLLVEGGPLGEAINVLTF